MSQGPGGGTAMSVPPASESVSFEEHVKPLFRERDQKSMLSAFDLWSYDDVSRNADAVLAAHDAARIANAGQAEEAAERHQYRRDADADVEGLGGCGLDVLGDLGARDGGIDARKRLLARLLDGATGRCRQRLPGEALVE